MVETCIIVGMGHAAAQLVPSLRQNGWEGRIVMIGEENMLPYHRPPLSKDFLLGQKEKNKLLIRPESSYEKLRVGIRKNTRVQRINRQNNSLSLAGGEIMAYTKLILATGGQVKRLNLPSGNHPNIFYIRNIKDAIKIKAAVKPGKRAVVIGGGYIGLEAAAVLRQLEVEVTLLEAADKLLSRVTSPEMSAFFEKTHKDAGVKIHYKKMVQAFRGEDRATEVICSDGSSYECDMVIVGIGIKPNDELAEVAGLDIKDGIRVDKYGQTSDPNIYAVGDCTNHPSYHYKRSCRLESVPHATDQARSTAASICGNPTPYQSFPWFWSDQFDLKLQTAGLLDGYDEIVIRGDMENTKSFVIWYLKDGELIAADCLNRPREFMVARKLIPQKVSIPAETLANEEINLKDFLVEA